MAKRKASAVRLALFLIVIIVLSIFVVGQFGVPLASYTAQDADVTTHSYDWYGAYGGGATGNCLPSDAACSPSGHLLDQDKYIASYSPNQIGQRATAIGAIKLENECSAPFGSLCAGIEVDNVILTFTLTWPDGTTTQVGQYATKPDQQLVSLDKWYQEINSYWDVLSPDGKTIIPSGTILTVTLQVHVNWLLVGITGAYRQDKGTGSIASVQANIISGIGSTTFTNPHSDSQGNIYYITGETVTFSATVGYVSQPGQSSFAWEVYAYCEAANAVVFGPTSVTQLTQSFSFKLGSNCFNNATANNEVVIQLRNALYNYDFKVAATVRPEDVSHMPTCTQPTVTPQSPQQGQTITLTWSCQPASSSSQDVIAKIKVEWGYGSIQNTVYLAGSATSYSFTAAQSGYVVVAITAYTVNNVPSGTSNTKIQVDHQYANNCSNGASSCSTNPPNLYWLVLLIAGIVALAAAAFLPTDMKAFKFKPFARVIVAIAGIMLIGIGYLVFGV